MKRAFGILLVMCSAIVNSAFAQKPAVVTSNEPGWHKIGEITASFKMDNESISVLGADEFSAIKLKVTDAPINIEHIHIFYESGEMEEVAVKNELIAGAETRVIKLKHSDKEIKKVTFTYKTLPNSQNEKAEVELYGLKTREDGSDAIRNDKNEDRREEAEESVREERREEAAERTENHIKKDAKETENDIDNGAEKVGDGVSEAVGKVGAEIKDKTYANKVGPDGQKIFIDKHSKYYYIDNEGKKVYVTKLELKDKPDNN